MDASNPINQRPGDASPIQRLSCCLLNAVRYLVPQTLLTWEQILLAMAVSLLPLFYLTVKNWTEAWLVILAALSIYGIFKARLSWRALFPDRSAVWIFASLTFPIVAIAISILIRGDLHWSLWGQNMQLLNGPSRLFLAGFAFLWMSYRKVRFLDAFQVVSAISIVITTFFATTQQPGAGERYTTSLLDLCAFGQQICLLGLMQFYFLIFHPPRSRLVLALTVISIALAAKMGIAAGGRGGWIAVPPVLVIAALLYRGNKVKILALLLAALLAVGGVLAINETFRDRLTSVYTETAAWLSGDATAGGSGRLTIMAISWELIKDNPVQGYAIQDNLWEPVYRMDPNRYMRKGFRYEDVEPYKFTLCDTGEHNQYLYTFLMNGIFGFLSLLLLLFVPFVVFGVRLFGAGAESYAAAAIGVGFVAAFMVFCTTQGPFNYKVITSFYGFVIAGLAASHGRLKDT